MSRYRATAREGRANTFERGANGARRPLTTSNYQYGGGKPGLRECPECFQRGGHEDWCARNE